MRVPEPRTHQLGLLGGRCCLLLHFFFGTTKVPQEQFNSRKKSADAFRTTLPRYLLLTPKAFTTTVAQATSCRLYPPPHIAYSWRQSWLLSRAQAFEKKNGLDRLKDKQADLKLTSRSTPSSTPVVSSQTHHPYGITCNKYKKLTRACS